MTRCEYEISNVAPYVILLHYHYYTAHILDSIARASDPNLIPDKHYMSLKKVLDIVFQRYEKMHYTPDIPNFFFEYKERLQYLPIAVHIALLFVAEYLQCFEENMSYAFENVS